ncbi:zinc finger CCCH domain-containing protein 43-like [Populus alba x Populus x berolinensis]|nr:zinc finger CCCH domain-containing protein 43-like [Populus alba x Populus x berolinensis]KAJ7013936.1 zinc finger CCCH domain-containing protein 43-like [Populus alba x Populus x berolinensis]
MKTADVSTNNLEQIQCEEFPHRLGQPECCYFTITGNCKYKSSCRYHHPKDISSKSHVCTLNSKGLPPRPDKRICRHYEQFGPRCLYDHPENYSSSAFQLDAFPEPSSASKLVSREAFCASDGPFLANVDGHENPVGLEINIKRVPAPKSFEIKRPYRII